MTVQQNGLEVAVIGMAGRFPGSQNVEQFWDNLTAGKEFSTAFESESTSEQIKAAALLEDIDRFDASFFGINPREAEIMDPQHRIFLECAWSALENAGYDTTREERPIGVYAGVGASTYLIHNLLPNNLNQTMGYFPTLLASDKDYAPTRVSYKLNLKGPSLSIGTACSSSLVAVNLAYQSLLGGECDMALAAGVSIKAPQIAATLCPEGVATDGHCRAFDADANGTIGGNGAGVVVLKRLADAIADGDYIYSVIKGSAVNNDGAVKVSYTAPSEQAQTTVIQTAQLMAEVDPETITYIETHGTGTKMGDPIEIAALTEAFATDKKSYCAIGSVKTNMGHLDAAAGITSFIKTSLSLDRQLIPPSINFATPSPEIDFANSPFFVNTELSNWESNGTPRRAGVSSFGFGGTNAHIILEEAPERSLELNRDSSSAKSHQVLLLSAKTSSALETATSNLVTYLQEHSECNLSDVAHTLQIGRQQLIHKRAVICETVADAISALTDPKRVLTSCQATDKKEITFLFTGLGTHYVGMARELYQTEAVFKQAVDHCCQILEPLLSLDLRGVIYPPEDSNSNNKKSQPIDLRQMLGRTQTENLAATTLNQTQLTQPAIFVLEYALAQLWQSWGIRPNAMIGYSIGEYVVATIAGVFSLEDALTLVAKRAEMIAQLTPGAMLAVPLTESAVKPLLNEQLSLSAVNGSNQCVVAGIPEVIDKLEEQLAREGTACRRLQSSHAFHSQMMEAIATPFRELVASFQLNPPQIPYLSNLTGTWVTPELVTQPDYWVQHLCQPVRFAQQVQELWQQQQPIMLEVGAGQTLSSLALQCLESVSAIDKIALPSLRHDFEGQSDTAFILNTLAQLWLSGVEIDWFAFSQGDCQRLPLPTYPFEDQRYWIDPPTVTQSNHKSDHLWQSLVTTAQEKAITGLSNLDQQLHETQRESLDRLCIAYIKKTFQDLGLFQREQDDQYSLAELNEKSGTIPRFQELLERWLDILVQRGEIHQDAAGNFSQLKAGTASIPDLVREVKEKSPGVLAPEWIDIYHNYGVNLGVIMTGERQPLEFHFSMNLEREGYTLPEYPSMDYYEPIMGSIIQQIVNSLPNGKKLRILELGAGTGSATEKILPLLPPEATEYTFTDVGSYFINLAQEKFKPYPFITYGVLDVEKSPQEQGYNPNEYDLVIAFNVLHVASDVDATIDYGRSLLAPKGLLLLWEITRERLEADIMDGVLMQPIADPVGIRNMGNPYLSAEQWQERLIKAGFPKVETFSEFDSFGEHIIIAEANSKAITDAKPAFSIPLARINSTRKIGGSESQKPDLSDWFYAPSWKRSPLPSRIPKTKPGFWLVFTDECSLGERIIEQLELSGHNIVIVQPGAEFSGNTSQSKHPIYTINPHQQNDYQTLIRELSTLSLLPQKIIHLWMLNPESDPKTVEHLGFYSLLFLAQAWGEHSPTENLEINVISRNMQELTGSEEICPEKALVTGPIKVIPTEYPNINCRCLDLVLPSPESRQQKELVVRLLRELNTPISEQIIAYRGRHRWLQTFEPVRLDAVVEQHSRLKKKGVYLITGGLGGVGLTIANYLAEKVQAKLILMGRSSFPNRADWSEWLANNDKQDNISQKIRQIQHLETLGAEIIIVSADVANLEQMQGVITQVHTRFGQIQGVIHAAFVRGGGIIQFKSKETIAADIAPKVQGMRVLEQLFKKSQLDFLILCSSLRTLSPEAGLVDYSAENSFLDSFAHYSSAKYDWFVRSIDWDVWSGVGTAVTVQQEYQAISGKDFRRGMTSEDGIEAFERILFQSTEPQVVVSTQDLLIEKIEQQLSLLDKEKTEVLKSKHQRPKLKNAYVAPSNDTEKAIAKVWQKFLGIEAIGIHDNFFALGGDSLTGSILINQLRDNFRLELPVRSLFDSPTIAELGVAIENLLIAELEALDEAEAQSLLQQA